LVLRKNGRRSFEKQALVGAAKGRSVLTRGRAAHSVEGAVIAPFMRILFLI
jgi:hypothetical protein